MSLQAVKLVMYILLSPLEVLVQAVYLRVVAALNKTVSTDCIDVTAEALALLHSTIWIVIVQY
jgi:hypothetical protein